MAERNTRGRGVTIGLDLGDKWSEGAVLDARGELSERARVRTTQKGFAQAFTGYEGARLVLEVGTHSPWASRSFAARHFEVIVANPRRTRLIAESDKKNDRFDAEQLARLGRIDPDLLSPIVHRGEEAQRDRILLLSRTGMVRARTQLTTRRGDLPSHSELGFPRAHRRSSRSVFAQPFRRISSRGSRRCWG